MYKRQCQDTVAVGGLLSRAGNEILSTGNEELKSICLLYTSALARLKQCTAEWSSAPQDEVVRKTWMEAVPEMEKVLSNPQSLQKQAEEALKLSLIHI